MKLRINETKYNRKRYNLISNEEYDYWFNIGLKAFERDDKCIPIHSKELIDYMTKNPAKIGSTESKKSNQLAKAWADGWNYGNIHQSFE